MTFEYYSLSSSGTEFLAGYGLAASAVGCSFRLLVVL
ncbi:hypothetical protein FOPG_20145 [Fusarium oxysporum f. sp. conglutinans race 2 54008]|uniref:Uncharacterized protein n=1 Tax=Fusarium oxysporum f. sp. conglutinans race 2 54008 TaxID=1089457 RepID=X0GUQ1_FUSOX|nr:hypothetical protein FOPG_20145 [Fusarium oxysporum f. sp. conglutinans race 2 54008]